MDLFRIIILAHIDTVPSLGLGQKFEALKAMNMTRYKGKKNMPQIEQTSCLQHVDQMKEETAGTAASFYSNKTKTFDLLPLSPY